MTDGSRMVSKEDQIMFAFAPTNDGQPPIIILAIPDGAWNYMKEGKTHTFDLQRAGVPIRFMLFGCRNRTEAAKLLNDSMANAGVPYLNETGTDFSIHPKAKP